MEEALRENEGGNMPDSVQLVNDNEGDGETNKNVEKTYTDPQTGKFIKGNPGGGRPKGSISIKDKIRQYLEDNPQNVDEIVQYFVKNNRELMWQMLEGRPQQDVTSGGKELPTPLLYGLYNNERDKENNPTEEKDPSSAGGDFSREDNRDTGISH